MATSTLPALLKAYRERRGLSQSQCAMRWALPVRTLQNWEAGRIPANAAAIEALLRELG